MWSIIIHCTLLVTVQAVQPIKRFKTIEALPFAFLLTLLEGDSQ